MQIMKVKRITAFSIYFLIFIFIAAIGYSAFTYLTNKPPLEEINLARESLAAAKEKMAGKYANETLKEAESLYK